MPDNRVDGGSDLAEELIDPAIALVQEWLVRATQLETREDRATFSQLGSLVGDDAGVGLVMAFVDRVARPEGNRVAAGQLSQLVRGQALPSFLSIVDQALLRVGARLAPLLPPLVMPLARGRMRSIVGHLVAPAAPSALRRHLQSQRGDGYELNVNLLGEAVLGEREAQARLDQLIALLAVPGVDYVSVKLSAVSSQLNHWAYDQSLDRVTERLGVLLDAASAASPATFVNFDMEEYHDLDMTVAAFKRVLEAPSRRGLDAGIVLQAYLPDVFAVLGELVEWANERHRAGGGSIKIRLVKGANLAMERVDAALHGWEQAPFSTKLESDASYRRCLDWVLQADRLQGVRIGVASHNLFDVAWAMLLAEARGVTTRVQFEMLQGMASGQAKAVNESASASGHPPMLLYTPAVGDDDFDVAISYLFRRLEENASPENFMRALFDLSPGSAKFEAEADFFRKGVALRNHLTLGPARTQNRLGTQPAWNLTDTFRNEPDTDPTLRANRTWISAVASASSSPCATPMSNNVEEVTAAVDAARAAGERWRSLLAHERRTILHAAGDRIAAMRGELITTMMHEASKTFAEADGEVSEAIDFARWYADQSVELHRVKGATFTPFGVTAVIPPWNFPIAIPAGGVLASLASGNAVVFKPAPQTPRCAELIAQACWAAGVPSDLLQFMRTPDNEVGRHLIESVDAVILTGSTETADLFRSWKPDLRLFAETSGKNALIISPSADMDLAVEDLVMSAFGHGGQKCSAASLAILVGDVYTSERFRRQLIDAVESLNVGSSLDLDTDIAPLVDGGNERLEQARTTLDPGESWLVAPQLFPGGIFTPGVRDGVVPGSWFHRTECFGPVLGLMFAPDLDTAIDIANSSEFGLTGGIHTLDPSEVARWAERIEVGNGYVNRPITGAIVQRQPFGGWKRSSVGPGAKAGGPNYLMQLGQWTSNDVVDDYEQAWSDHFSQSHDETGLFCEANIFRYRPRVQIGVRVGADADPAELALVRSAAALTGVSLVEVGGEPTVSWLQEMIDGGVDLVRFVGMEPDVETAIRAGQAGVHLVTGPVTPSGRIELQNFCREQALSITLHRFGNLVSSPALKAATGG